MTYPASLINHLRDLAPGFATELPNRQHALAAMLWMQTESRRMHFEWRGAISISKQDNRDIWGSDQYMRDSCWRYFSVLKGSNLGKGTTNAYIPKAELAAALELTLADPAPDDWIDANQKVMRTFPRVIASLSGSGKKTKWKGLAPAGSISIDIQSLKRLRLKLEVEARSLYSNPPNDIHGQDERAERLDKVKSRQLTIDALIKLSANTICPGSTPIRYVEQSTGRLFAQGLSLQSAPKQIRNAALVGCWDYDISNCHWSLIHELAARHGLVCHAIQHYLDNKSIVRNEIAKGAGITVDEAKTCLLMIMFGAHASTYEDAGIPSLIGVKAASRLYRLPQFKRLLHDVVRARRVIIANLNVRRGGWVSNALGLEIPRKVKPEVLLAHIIQGLGMFCINRERSCLPAGAGAATM